MCGISAIFGSEWNIKQLEQMVNIQNHRGPDGNGIYISDDSLVGLGHNRLSIIDLSDAATQPMYSADNRYILVFNGEIYNYIELKSELSDYPFRTASDTEVLLAAYLRWGSACVHRLIGMFSFIIWDTVEHQLFAARDRFGVKPFYYHIDSSGNLFCASEIQAIHAAGIPRIPNERVWATYLSYGVYDHDITTFWDGIFSLRPGHTLTMKNNQLNIARWYALDEHVQELDVRPLEIVQDEYLGLLEDSIRLRFRSDVPVGINLSGGVDSSTLLGLVNRVQGTDSSVKAYTFITNHPDYDETPWVEAMLAHTKHQIKLCPLSPHEVPALADSVYFHTHEPYGGIPTLAYAKLFAIALSEGTIVLLDGQGMDEQWAGYDYYRNAYSDSSQTSSLQGSKDQAVRPECLKAEFRELANIPQYHEPFEDRLLNRQYRDVAYTKIPRALRFNDRVSMRSSTELRVPFLDHRLVELAFRQPSKYKIADGQQKWFLRQLAQRILPPNIVEAPKRALQTPQREWLRHELREWAEDYIDAAIHYDHQHWIDGAVVETTWQQFLRGESDNSFHVWQWISLGMLSRSTKQ